MWESRDGVILYLCATKADVQSIMYDIKTPSTLDDKPNVTDQLK